jgi:hypothetical protein
LISITYGSSYVFLTHCVGGYSSTKLLKVLTALQIEGYIFDNIRISKFGKRFLKKHKK